MSMGGGSPSLSRKRCEIRFAWKIGSSDRKFGDGEGNQKALSFFVCGFLKMIMSFENAIDVSSWKTTLLLSSIENSFRVCPLLR